MSTGVWEPSSDLPANGNIAILSWCALGNKEQVSDNVQKLSEQQIKTLVPLMKQDAAFWADIAAPLSTNDIRQLIYFFTVAEQTHSALFAGNQSPVISLNRILKQRGTPLVKDDILWIKQHSSNRFLPNGSINLQLS